jgi:hypothetical protein
MENDLVGALKELSSFRYFNVRPSTVEIEEKSHHLFIEGKILCWNASFRQAGYILPTADVSAQASQTRLAAILPVVFVAALCEQRRLDFAEATARQAAKCVE